MLHDQTRWLASGNQLFTRLSTPTITRDEWAELGNGEWTKDSIMHPEAYNLGAFDHLMTQIESQLRIERRVCGPEFKATVRKC